MESLDDYQKCLNCEVDDFRFTRGYCIKCYPLILKIEKIQKGILPNILEDIKTNFGLDYFEGSKEEYISQIKRRLEIIKEARSLKQVTAHDLEYRINNTLRILDKKSLGKINDPLAHYLKDDRARSYVYQLFTKIQLLKPFKIDPYLVYDAGHRSKVR
ncbi:MAG: hypothetical protein WAV15_02835 [Minisyncoccia bacterium]